MAFTEHFVYEPSDKLEFYTLIFSFYSPIYEVEGEMIMVRGVPNIAIPTLSYYGVYGGKMSLPVDSSSLVYSNFEHVSGIPAPKGTAGISISKLNLLDVLINRIDQINSNGASLAPGLKDGSIDSVIENLADQIRQAETNNASMPYLPTPNAQPGALFSLIA